MNAEIGTKAAQFPEKEHINGIFVAVRHIKTSAGTFVMVGAKSLGLNLVLIWGDRFCNASRSLHLFCME